MTKLYDAELADIFGALKVDAAPDAFMDYLLYCIDALENGRDDCIPNPSAASLCEAVEVFRG